MKNPLQTLLIGLALALCALCAWQWHSQALQHQQFNVVSQTNYDQQLAIRGYTNQLATLDQQVAQLDARLTECQTVVQSNHLTVAGLLRENASFSNQVHHYQAALATFEAQIKQANETIRQQNTALQDVVTQRDEFVAKLNASIQERNALVTQYNELVKRVQELAGDQPDKKK